MDLTFAEMTDQVFEFVQDRAPRPLRHELYPDAFHDGPEGYDVMSLIFRMEGYPRAERREILTTMRRRIRDDGQLFLAFVNRRSYHRPLRWMRGRIGHKGVEYALAPDPSLGPFKAATPARFGPTCRPPAGACGIADTSSPSPRRTRSGSAPAARAARSNSPARPSRVSAVCCNPSRPSGPPSPASTPGTSFRPEPNGVGRLGLDRHDCD